MAKKNEEQTDITESSAPSNKKSTPTRSRREAELANRRPLVPNDRKLAKQIERQKRDEAYARERVALETGNERYLPVRDKGPIRRYVRDWIDARWSISEFLLPAMILFLGGVLILTFVKLDERFVSYVMVGLMVLFYALLAISVVEGIIVWLRMKSRLKKIYPDTPIPKGTWFYMYTRMVMARRWRSPKPQVARGDIPDPDGPRAAAKKADKA
ncbi:MAG: DUF3043 domain-containing protein [Scrofimicrobium sp.]